MQVEAGSQIGPYIVEAQIGEGAMGAVFRARHGALGGLRALKVLWRADPQFLPRFEVEGLAQARLRHSNVVAVHDCLEHQQHPVLVLEYVAGGDLRRYLENRPPLPEPLAHLLATGIVRGVRAVHGQGIVHRDLKPLNIMLASIDGVLVPKIADFGLAKWYEADSSRLTRAGATMGTPSYMAPEQFRQAREADGRADLFAIGAILYELATGRQAFPEVLAVDVLRRRMQDGVYKPPEHFRPDCPEPWRRAIRACLHPDRDRRMPDCDALLDLLERSAPGDVPPIGAPTEMSLLRHPVPATTATASVEPAPKPHRRDVKGVATPEPHVAAKLSGWFPALVALTVLTTSVLCASGAGLFLAWLAT